MNNRIRFDPSRLAGRALRPNVQFQRHVTMKISEAFATMLDGAQKPVHGRSTHGQDLLLCGRIYIAPGLDAYKPLSDYGMQKLPAKLIREGLYLRQQLS